MIKKIICLFQLHLKIRTKRYLSIPSLRGGVANEAIHIGIKQFQNWIASASPRKDEEFAFSGNSGICRSCIGILLLLLFTNVVFAATDLDNVEELGKILQTTTSLKADFSQELYDKAKILRKTSGSMAVKKPNLFRWQAEKPERNLIVIDGKRFWNYDEELQQVTVQEIGTEDTYEASPISLFLAADIQDISKRYIVKKLSGHNSKLEKKICFELMPKNKADGFKKVELIFKAGVIDALVLVDQLEQISKIKFTNVQANVNLAHELFSFVPPKGADVVGLEE